MNAALTKVSAPPRWGVIAGGLLVGALFWVTRLSGLDADPPADMQLAFSTDEGWWAHNARNHALFGRWVMDDMNFGLYAAPVYTLLLRLSYAIGGVSLDATRLVSIAAGLATLVSIALIVRRESGARTALVAAALWTLDHFVTSYNRVAFVESTATAFMTLAMLAGLSRRHPRLGAFTGGVLALTACFTKMNSAFFLPVIPLALLFRHWAGPAVVRPRASVLPSTALASFCAGGLIAGGAAWVFFILPNWGPFILQNALVSAANVKMGWFFLISMPFSVGLSARGSSVYPVGFLYQSFVLIIAGALWFVHFACHAVRAGLRRQVARLGEDELAAAVWLVVFLVCLAFTIHSYDRRYYPLSVPLSILAANFLTRRWGESFGLDPATSASKRAWRDVVPALVACTLFVIYARAPLANAIEPLTRGLAVGRKPGLSADGCCAVAAVFVLMVLTPVARSVLRLAGRAQLRVRSLALGLVTLALGFSGLQHVRAFATRTYTFRDAGAWLSKSVGENSCVAGGLAETLLFDSTTRTFALQDRRFLGFGIVNADHLAALKPTHCLLDGDVGEHDLSNRVAAYLQGWGTPVTGTRQGWALCPEPDGRPRLFVTLCEVAPVGIEEKAGL